MVAGNAGSINSIALEVCSQTLVLLANNDFEFDDFALCIQIQTTAILLFSLMLNRIIKSESWFTISVAEKYLIKSYS